MFSAHSMALHNPDPLRVIVVGAGVGGLTAAAALRRSGHNVTIFEQSRFSAEVGAAIHVGCNASRALSYLGYSEQRLAGVESGGMELYDNNARKTLTMNYAGVKEQFKSPWYLCHRVDLHNELKHLALAEDVNFPPCDLRLSSKVDHIDPETGRVTLTNGEIHEADLIVGADSVYSHVRDTVFNSKRLESTGEAAYRFMLESSMVTQDPDCLPIDPTDGYLRIIIGSDRRIVIYPCRNFELLNIACIHPDEIQDNVREWNSQSTVEEMLETYKDFSPQILNILKK